MKRAGCLFITLALLLITAALHPTTSEHATADAKGGPSAASRSRAKDRAERTADDERVADMLAGLAAPAEKELAQQLVASAENSTLNWREAYGYIEDIGDGQGYTA